MKKIIYMFLAAAFLISCSNDDKINTSESATTADDGGVNGKVINPQNPLDKYIEKHFSQPYSINILSLKGKSIGLIRWLLHATKKR